MKKVHMRFGGLVLALVLMLGMMPLENLAVYAETATCSCGNHTYEITGTGDDKTITISGSGTIDYNCGFFYDSVSGGIITDNSVKKVVISSGITSLGSNAFYNCTDITDVTIPSSVTSIGESAFNNCMALTSITIPDTVTTIGERAFNSCEGLTSVTIPSSVTSIGDEAFAGCIGLTSLEFKGTTALDNIGDDAFCGVGTTDGCEAEDDNKKETPCSLKVPSTWTTYLPDEDGIWWSGYFALVSSGTTYNITIDTTLTVKYDTGADSAVGGDVLKITKDNDGLGDLEVYLYGGTASPWDGTSSDLDYTITTDGTGGCISVSVPSGYKVTSLMEGANGANPACLIEITPISTTTTIDETIAVTDITAPVRATALDTAGVCSTTGIATTTPSVTWKVGDTVKTGTAEALTEYTAYVTLEASAGYQFETSPAVTISGYTATVTRTGDTHIIASYTFPTTAKETPATTDFTFTAPASLDYDGTAKTATVTATSATEAEIGAITVKYKKSTADTWTTTAPIEAGTYYVEIDVAGGSKYEAATDLQDATNWKYTINKIAPTASDFVYTAPTDFCFGDDFPSDAIQVKEGISGLTILSAKAYSKDRVTWSTGLPTTEGTWYVGILVKASGSSNYKNTYSTYPNYLSDAAWSFTVSNIYDIALDANGGSSTAGTITYISITGTGTFADCELLPTAWTKYAYKAAEEPDTYSYDGTNWYLDGDEISESLSVMLSGYSGTPVAGDTFTIKSETAQGERVSPGNSITATATRAGYSFDGWYTAKEGGTKVTTPTSDKKLYAHWTKNDEGKIDIPEDKEDDNYGGGSIADSEDDLKDIVLTDDDKSALESGKDISIWVEVEDISDSVSDSDKTLVDGKLSENYQIGAYLDINLWKQVTGDAAVKVTELPNGNIKITIQLPTSLQKKGRSYKIIRLHDGVAEEISADVSASYSLSFETDRFSTYAIEYTDQAGDDPDEPDDPDNPDNPDSDDSDSSSGHVASPKTGDTNANLLWLLLLIAGAGVAVCGIGLRKCK